MVRRATDAMPGADRTGLRAARPHLRDDGGVSPEPDPRASPESPAPSEPDRTTGPAADPATGGEAGAGGPARPRPRVGPRPMQKPGRTETRMKDMVGAILILIPIALLIVGVRSCTFAPTGPEIDQDAGPTIDAPARLGEYARTSTFALRVPAVPWRSNSTDRGPVAGGGTAVRVGYLTEPGRYLRLVQSDASEEALLGSEFGGAAPVARGVTQAAGLSWVTYQAANGEPIRIAGPPADPNVRLLITGSGNDDEFRTLAEATVRGRVLPPGGGTN